ncbi:MAG: FGGY-family carbohydrate kinase [Desulfosalsimonadaceae bacterium]
MSKKTEKYILAVDLGTSGPKSALVSTRGEIIADAFVENDLFLLDGGGAEQDPEQWWQSILETFRVLLAKRLVPPEEIAAVCCSSQWSGTVAVDENGRHLMNALVWLDSRGSPYIDAITGGPLKIQGYDPRKLLRWIRLTGGAPSRSGKDSIAHILYIKNRLPDVYQRTYKFLEPKDYLNLRFTGIFAASGDSITLHWVTDNRNIERICYDDRLVKLSTIERSKFPDLVQAASLLGPIKKEVADDLGLSPSVKVISGMPDVQAAAVGSGAVADFAAHLYIGTSSWLTCHVPFKKTLLSKNIASLPSAIPGRYFVANEQESAGACLKFLRDNLFFPQDAISDAPAPHDFYQRLDLLAAGASPGSGGLLFLPWLYGERTPIDDPLIRGGFVNLSLEATRAEIVRAVLEGVAFNSRWLLGAVEKFAGRRIDPIRMIGGGAASDVWCRIHADALDRTIEKVKDPLLANVRGAGLLGAAAMGYIPFSKIGDTVEIERTYTPEPAHRNVYDTLFREFTLSYRRTRKTCARLNRASCISGTPGAQESR